MDSDPGRLDRDAVEAVEAVEAALAESPRVDERRISVRVEDGEVVLDGAVATPQEAAVAALIAEREVPDVVNALQVDPGLREGDEDPDAAGLEAEPLDAIDRLEGDAAMTTDLEEALGENEPYEPPDEPFLGGPDREEPDAAPLPGTIPSGDAEPDPLAVPERVGPAAADLSPEDLRRAAQGGGGLPSLDPAALPEEAVGDEAAEGSPPAGTGEDTGGDVAFDGDFDAGDGRRRSG